MFSWRAARAQNGAAVRASSSVEELKRLLPQCLLPDQVRLGRGLADGLARRLRGEPAPMPLARWLAQARASIRLREQRRAILKHLAYPGALPISARKDEIVAAIRAHPVVVVAGETGSGKTTQLPKMCLEAGLGLRAQIGCTQPRRVAALSIARRLAEELGMTLGRQVGSKIRFADHTRPETSVKVMTDGILLAEVQADPLLADYEAILIDEAHERSLNIDILLGFLKLLLARRDDLKLIITSATIDTERFARAFNHAPVIEVSGRLHPVEVRYAPLDEGAEAAGDVTYVDAAVDAAGALLAEPQAGDVLVFMPSERDIRETCERLAARHRDAVEVVPMFGRLAAGDQQRVFSPGPRRRVVVATNIAETSLTVPRIRYVVDTGLARISRYHPGTRSRRLPIEPISQSSADQRQGRCGRLGPGICLRLYAEADYQARPRYTEPEIRRCDLADVLLRLKAFRLGELETFPFLEPPTPQAIASAYQLLQELGALDESRHLTPLGRDLARLPVDPAAGRMILEAQHQHALPEVLVIAAGLSIQDPRERPLELRDAAETAHRRFEEPRSDFLTLLNIWNAYHDTWESLKTQNQLRKFCKAHFLSFLRMREWVDVHAQLEEAVQDLKNDWSRERPIPNAANPPPEASTTVPEQAATRHGLRAGMPLGGRWYAAIHRSILTGLFGHVARREERNLYRLGGNKQAMIFPGSGLFEKPGGRSAGPGRGAPAVGGGSEAARRAGVRGGGGMVDHGPSNGRREGDSAPCAEQGQGGRAGQPPWLVAGELLETSRLFLRRVAEVDPEWVIELGPHLVRVTHEHPRWERRAGRVLCTERVLLRGLVLRERPVGYLQINPAEATEIFIRAALVEEDVDGRYAFLEHNRRLRRKLELWQTRIRHRAGGDLGEALFRFYAGRLERVGSVHDLNRVLKAQCNPQFLCATVADLLGDAAAAYDTAAFPDAVRVGSAAVPLSYAYAPGEEEDGVTFRLTYALAEVLAPGQLDWLVPALREERVLHLLEALPKNLRRPLVPLPACAQAIAQAIDPHAGSVLGAIRRLVRERHGVDISEAAWPVAALPPHLQPRFEIVGSHNQTLAAGRDLHEVCERARQSTSPSETGALKRALERWERRGLTAWTVGDLPERCLVSETGGVPFHLYPGLHFDQVEVGLRLFRRAEEATAASRIGVPRLAERVLHGDLARVQQDLRALRQFALLHAPLGPVEELIETAWDNVRAHLLAPPDVPPRTRQAFDRYVENIRAQAAGLGPVFLARVGAVLEKRQETLNCRRPFPELRAAVERLVPRRFLRAIPFRQLGHVPRYLRALQIRAERAALNPAKDAAKRAQVQPYAAAVQRLLSQPPPNPEALRAREHCRWLFEEFNVSVFAQELGTAMPVSARRLDDALREARRLMG